MNKNRLKEKEQTVAEINKERQPQQEEGAERVIEAKRELPAPKIRKFPQFMVYFQVYDIASRDTIVEFEDCSESTIKSKAVKEELSGHRTRLLSNKYTREVPTLLPTIYEGYHWHFYVTINNWIIFREIKSIL